MGVRFEPINSRRHIVEFYASRQVGRGDFVDIGYTHARGKGATSDILPLSESYTYNALGQLESVTVDFGPFHKTYSYTYYPNGLKKTYTNPEGLTYTYYYTKHNELAAVQIPGEGQIGFTDFYWQVPQTILLPGGSKVTLTYVGRSCQYRTGRGSL